MTEVIYDESKASSQSTVKTADGKTVRANNVVVVGGAKPSAVEEMPVASLNNKGKIVQYVGETTAEYTQAYFYICTEYVAVDSSISISQYEGAGVTPSVDKDTFETQITASGTYDFSYDGEKWYLDGEEVDLADYGITYTESEEATATVEGSGITDASVVLATFKTQVESTGNYSFVYDGSDWKLDNAVVDLADYGISYTAVTASASASQTVGSDLGTVSVNVATFATQATTSGTYNFIYDGSDWKFGETVVDLTAYGISYTGSSVPSSATISQTAGTGLTDVAVNVSTFESQISTAGSYVFTSDGTDWSYNGNVVDLTDYGITYTGTPVADDALTVVYTEAVVVPDVDDEIEVDYIAEGPYSDDTITVAYEKGLEAGEVLRVEYVGYVYGYQWLQINVQPGGGAGSVDSVNGKTGVVVLDAEDVGALPNDTPIPDPQVQADWDQTNPSAVDYIKNKPVIPQGGVPQYDTMPTASASNVGEIAQYSGQSILDSYQNGYFYKSSAEYSDPTATISQTTGSGLSDLSVNVDTFIEAEQPTQDETVAFVGNEVQESLSPTVFTLGEATITVDTSVFLPMAKTSAYSGDWNEVAKVVLSYNNISWGVDVYDRYDNSLGSSGGLNLEVWGISVDGTPVSPSGLDMFVMNYSPASFVWSKNATTVDLAEYGISYSGTPVDGDTLTVVYTAPAPIRYYWNQTDVQPSSGGGNAGIEWKTKVDLPAEYTGDMYSCTPYWTIAGGLPDGEYEFYFSTKCTQESSLPDGEVVYKIRVKINNQNGEVNGLIGYVFNGDYMNDAYYIFGNNSKDVYNGFRKNNNDLIFYAKDFPFISDIPNYISPLVLVKDCWKLSAFKNVETGQEYIATGMLNIDGSEPTTTDYLTSRLVLRNITSDPYIPTLASAILLAANDFGTKTVFLPNDSAFSVIHLQHSDSNSEFLAKLYPQNNSGLKPYSQEIVKATGIFADCYFASNSYYSILVGVDTVTASTLSGNVSLSTAQIRGNGASIWFEPVPQDTLTTISQCGPQGYRLGTIVADGIGNVVQYVGETDANYTNGYYYKATGTVITVPESISPSDYNQPDFVCGVTDLNDLVSAIASSVGWDTNYVRQQFANYDTWYYDIDFDSESTTITYANFGFWTTTDSSVLQYLTAVYSGSAAGNVQVAFSPNYTPEHKEVQNPAWQRIDTQPLDLTGITGYDATKTQVLKNVLGVLTWVDEV